MKPPRGYESLRRYRVTIPGASYFITLCTRDRHTGLNTPSVAGSIQEQIAALEADHALTIRATVIMPDHLHLFFLAGGNLSVGQIIGRLKTKTRGALAAVGIGWQGNFYEHRLRPDDAVEEVLRYLFLNPYRANLLPSSEIYPWFWLGPAEAEWFRPLLDDGRPFPEWLA
ncbi:MAG: transposase [Opitutaceae bacterium]|nr:transposase [Opitutaceae bacterium]